MNLSNTGHLAFAMFFIALTTSLGISVTKYRLWTFNESVYKANQKNMLKTLAFATILLLIALAYTILIQLEIITVGEYLTNDKGIRIDSSGSEYKVITSSESITSYILVVACLITIGLIIYYLTQIKAKDEIRPEELIEFAQQAVIDFDQAEKSYYVLKQSLRRYGPDKIINFDNYISNSTFMLSFGKKLFFKTLIKRTIYFGLSLPSKIPTFDQPQTPKNIIMVYLISSVKVINKTNKIQITVKDLADHLKGLTF